MTPERLERIRQMVALGHGEPWRQVVVDLLEEREELLRAKRDRTEVVEAWREERRARTAYDEPRPREKWEDEEDVRMRRDLEAAFARRDQILAEEPAPDELTVREQAYSEAYEDMASRLEALAQSLRERARRR